MLSKVQEDLECSIRKETRITSAQYDVLCHFHRRQLDAGKQTPKEILDAIREHQQYLCYVKTIDKKNQFEHHLLPKQVTPELPSNTQRTIQLAESFCARNDFAQNSHIYRSKGDNMTMSSVQSNQFDEDISKKQKLLDQQSKLIKDRINTENNQQLFNGEDRYLFNLIQEIEIQDAKSCGYDLQKTFQEQFLQQQKQQEMLQKEQELQDAFNRTKI